MARPFDVTAATDSIRLDAQGRGTTTFTVSNVSGRARRGRARLVPADPGQASWLSLDGEAEREFTADGTHQYTVRIATPPGTPPGRHTFGLDVVSVENPDEEWSQGPTVAFEVPATPPPPPPTKWWILLVILGLLLVGGLVAWLVTRNRTPEAVGLMGACAQDAECAAGLSCLVETPGQPGFCVGKPGFQGCSSTRQCAEGLTCQEQVCRGGPQTACDDQGDCLKGMACANKVCRGEKGFAVCAKTEDCVDGLFCVAQSCVSETVQQPCQTEAQCIPGQSCVQVGEQRYCLRPNGQPCSTPFECVSRNCAQKKCTATPIPCGGVAVMACPFGAICINNVCVWQPHIFEERFHEFQKLQPDEQ